MMLNRIIKNVFHPQSQYNDSLKAVAIKMKEHHKAKGHQSSTFILKKKSNTDSTDCTRQQSFVWESHDCRSTRDKRKDKKLLNVEREMMPPLATRLL